MIRRLLLGWNGVEGTHSQIVADTREQRAARTGKSAVCTLHFARNLLYIVVVLTPCATDKL